MIKLLKIEKSSKKVTEMLFRDVNELEGKLKRISTVKYNDSDYFITSENKHGFHELAFEIEEMYNENYYDIDYDLMAIKINRLTVGQRRLKSTNAPKESKKSIFDRGIIRMNNNNKTYYDELLNQIIVRVDATNTFVFELNRDRTEIVSLKLNGLTLEEIRATMRLSVNIKKQVLSITERIKKEGLN